MGKGNTTRLWRAISVLCVSFALVLSVIASGVGIAAVGAQSDADVTEIASCTVITEPGRYVLTEDIEGDGERRCIDISAEDVTLDGAGHTIDGTGTGIGIGAGDFAGGGGENATVTNVTVTDWGTGIYYEAVPGGAIRDSVVESNFRGIELGFFTDDVEVTGNTIVDNQVGLGTLFSTDNVFENNTVSDSERGDYESEGDRDEEGPSTATVRNLHLDTATLSFDEEIQFGSLRLDVTESAPSDPDDQRNVGQYVDVRSGSPGNGTLTFGVHYTDDDIGEAGVSEDSLRLYQFADGEWTELPGSAVDTDANVVITSVDNLSVLGTESVVAPLGDPADGDAGDGANDGNADGGQDGGDEQDGQDGQEGATEIESCAEIDEPGRYVLTGDVEDSTEDTCISITENDVVLDGDGHTIDGVDSGRAGIDVQGANVTVTDVVVTDWESGVNVDTDDAVVSNSVVESNRIGIDVELGREVTITDNEVRANGVGIFAFVSTELAITDNVVESNRDTGIWIDDTSLSVIANNTATGNGGAGIYLLEFSGANTLSGNVVSDNEYGLRLRSSFSTLAEDTVASNNSVADFYVESIDEINLVNNTIENFTTDSAVVSFVSDVDVRDTGVVSTDAALDAADEPPANPAGLTNVGGHVELTSPVEAGRAPASFISLEMHYDDADAQDVEEDSLALYRFVDGEWEDVSGSSVDTDANVVSANLTEFPAESFVVAPFGESADEGAGDGAANEGDEDDADEDGTDTDEDQDGEDPTGADPGDEQKDDRDGDGQKAPKPDEDDRDTGTENDEDDDGNGADGEDGEIGAEDGEESSGEDASAVFTEAIRVEFAGITISFGPPTDPDSDGVYDDVTGDGHVDVFDALAHATVVTAVNHGTVDLTSDQADALDIDRDGVVDYGDALALVDMN